ncbi:hypothetical protein [Telmatospirillum sp.]|uniref:hypothetical protein n=1 Tax=Telmatospirillum sp. TaxID=2079197 RepID=UPI00284900D4|nr:hypothetical protein [Telmatospirillum sp.]MDR3436892.1 hypothetical protein [Telmatospirillum sp.]
MDDGQSVLVDRSEPALRRGLAESRTILQDAFAPIESSFQRAGEDLSRAVDALQRVTRSSLTLSQQMAEDALATSTARLQTAATRVTELSGKTGTGQASLAALTSLTTGIEERIARLSRTISEAKILGINAKIEAAHVTARDVDFSVFTREIGRLAELAEASLAKLGAELASLGKLIDSARGDQETFERDNQQSLATVVRRLEANLLKIRERQQTATTASAVLGERSQSITGHVAKVVADLQIADITRQRVEHVVHGLDVAASVFDPSGDGEDVSDDQRRAIVAEICSLEAAQLHNAESDFSREINRIVENLKALAVDAEGIYNQGHAVFGAAGAGESSFLGELGRDLDQVCALLEKYAQSRGMIENVTRSVTTGVSEMVKYLSAVHSIEADMRVMGLNATLKCSRLGNEGRALSVIAQELRVFANRTADDGAIIMKGLEKLIAAAEGLASGDQSDDSTDITGLTEEMKGAVHTLEIANNELAGPIAALEDDSRLIGDALAGTVTHMTAQSGNVETLRRVFSRLEELAKVGPEEMTGDLQEVKERVLRMVKGRYTMAREHEIHALFDQVDGGDLPGGGVRPSGAPAAEAVNLDDFLF